MHTTEKIPVMGITSGVIPSRRQAEENDDPREGQSHLQNETHSPKYKSESSEINYSQIYFPRGSKYTTFP